MSMTPERMIAIALTGPFRKALDSRLSPEVDEDQILELDLEGYIEDTFELSVEDLPENLISAMRKALIRINDVFSKRQKAEYDKVLVEVVGRVLETTEKYLLGSYSKDEIEFLSEVVNDDRAKRFMNDEVLLSILFNGFGSVADSVEETVYDLMEDHENFLTEEMKKVLEEVKPQDFDKE